MPIPISFHIFQGDQVVRSETLAQDVIKIGKLDSSHRTILPGLRWFVLLYDLVRGRLPKLTVH